MDDLKYVLANLLAIEKKILEQYDYEKEKAIEHTGYKEIVALATEITEIIKEEENKKIIDDSFLL